jgi:hypothetical protein
MRWYKTFDPLRWAAEPEIWAETIPTGIVMNCHEEKWIIEYFLLTGSKRRAGNSRG